MSNSGFVSLELPSRNDVNDCQFKYKVPFNIMVMTILAGFRPNSAIIGKFRKLKKFYDHFVKRQK